MVKAFTSTELLLAFDKIGAAAVQHQMKLDIAVYGGSALMLASNFRFSSEDVDIAPLDHWPQWLSEEVLVIARENGWADDWLNEAVGVHLSQIAGDRDHVLLGSFPARTETIGLRIFVPSADYMLALKLKAMRVLDPGKGDAERRDILALLTVCGIETVDGAIAVLQRYFPVSASAPEKLRFLLKHILSSRDLEDGTPEYPVRRR